MRMSVDHSNTEATTPQFPLFQGILPFDRSKLMPEIVAGITLAALGIPEVMGYTKIIGTPVITGLYTLLLPVLAFAIFGSSRHLVVAADSATAAMISAALASYVGGPHYVALTSLVALVAGGLLLLAQRPPPRFSRRFSVAYRTGRFSHRRRRPGRIRGVAWRTWFGKRRRGLLGPFILHGEAPPAILIPRPFP